MIAAAMLYTVAITTLFGVAALAAERTFPALRERRRCLWVAALLASLILPCITLSTRTPAPDVTDQTTQSRTLQAVHGATQASNLFAVPASEPELSHLTPAEWPQWPQWDAALLRLWVASSAAFVLLLAITWMRSSRAVAAFPEQQMCGRSVLVAEDTGPAVFGVVNPRVIVPRWLLQSSIEVQAIVIAHEQSHIEARDALLSACAMALLAIAPWNIPLWWQLRRLRFAIEVDCDARVLKRGTAPSEYGETLLAIAQHGSRTPLGAIAMSKPVSQLERRIRIMTRPRSRGAWIVGLSLLATGMIACAATLSAPQLHVTSASHELIVPPYPVPDQATVAEQTARVIPALQQLVKEKYPQLWNGEFNGLPVLTVLFNEDGSVEKSDYQMTPGGPSDQGYGIADLERLGVSMYQAGYVQGEMLAGPNGEKVFARYGERKNAAKTYHYFTDPADTVDRTALEREVLERYFSQVLKDEVAQGQLWLIIDSEGRVLSTGQAAVTPALASGISSEEVERALRKRYPTLRPDRLTFTVILDSSSQPLKDVNGVLATLSYMWLPPGATLPAGTGTDPSGQS